MLTKDDLSAIGDLIDQKLDAKIDPVIELMAKGFGDVYRRFDEHDARFDQVDARFDRLDDRADSIALDVGEIKTRLGRVEQQNDGLAVTVYGRI